LLFVAIFISLSNGQCSVAESYPIKNQVFAGTIRDIWPCSGSPDGSRCGAQLNAGVPTPPCAIPNSGWQCAVDFENEGGDDIGALSFNLNTQYRIPVLYNGATGTVSDPAQFALWYRDAPGFNIPIAVNLTATNNPAVTGVCDALIFNFNNQNFYPINGQGFGNFYQGRNYGFTFDLHTEFTYEGNEFFNFAGDDDVWVFINDKLALDLGGVHGTEGGSLDLTWPTAGCGGYTLPSNPRYCATKYGSAISIPCACLLGLQGPGNTYTFDLFYNERHTVGSDLAFTSSLQLVCPFYDHCGVCLGDGQSCCQCPSKTCYTSRCDVNTSACIYTFSVEDCPYGSCSEPYPFFGPTASSYNAYTNEDFVCVNSDVQGRLAVGGDASVQDYSIACDVSTTGGHCESFGSVSCADLAAAGTNANSFVVGGNLFATNGEVIIGNVVYGDTFNNAPTFQAGSGCSFVNQATDFSSSGQYLQDLSLSVSTLAATGSVTNNYGSYVLTGTYSSTMEVFSLTADQLCNSYGFTINGIQSTASLFINVAGSSISCGNFGMQGYSANKAVFNFFEATSVSIFNIQWQGSILAPLADATNFGNGVINGQVFLNSISESGNCNQINWVPFTGCVDD